MAIFLPIILCIKYKNEFFGGGNYNMEDFSG